MTLLDLAVKIGVDDQASNKVSEISEHIGNGLKKAAKIGVAAVTAASAAVVKLAKDSIDAYADYEQLVGGVDTLFKNSSKKLQQYAANAYKTAGLSANQYMETATSFSASLLQSLEGDTEAAVEYADVAITDMADNANKMGTSIEMIQNAYQGFAKQNYTMLDNLKLGYGGTATEMARLINDSGILKDKLIDLTDTKNIGYQISKVGLAGIAEAIHIVQTEMGITGTTAKEAMETISGSAASAKSAWENLKTGIADENADIELHINNFVESAEVAADNLVNRALITIDGIIGVFEDSEKRQKFIDLGKTLLSKISEGMKTILGIENDENPLTWAGKTARDIIVKITDYFSNHSGDLLKSGKGLLSSFFDGLLSNDDDTGRSYEFVAGKVVGNVIKAFNDVIYGFGSGVRDIFNIIGEYTIALLTGNNDKLAEIDKKFLEAEKQFWEGFGYGIDPNAGYVSSGYNSNYQTEIGPNLPAGAVTSFIPTPGKTPTVGDMTFNITYANPNSNPREIGEAVQTALEEAEAANG